MDTGKPSAGQGWSANFYKCADKTSHPHWGSWAKVEVDRPAFHLPAYFGTLEFSSTVSTVSDPYGLLILVGAGSADQSLAITSSIAV